VTFPPSGRPPIPRGFRHTVNELRIHGVGGSPGPKLLGFDDPREVRVDTERSMDAITIRSRRDDHGTVVGFDWGDLTSGAMVQALWVFLLPFTLLNVAGWAHTSAGARRGSMWRNLTRVLVVLAGWLLTMTWVLWIADLLVGYVAYQWAPRALSTIESVQFPWVGWHLTLTPLGKQRGAIVVCGLLVFGLLMLAKLVAGRARDAVGEPKTSGSNTFVQGESPFSTSFFEKRPSWFASLLVHVAIAGTVVVVVVVQAWIAAGRTPTQEAAPIDGVIALVAGVNLAVLVALVLCSWVLPRLAAVGKATDRGVRRPNGTAAAAAVMATALTNAFFSGAVLAAVNYLSSHPSGYGEMKIGRDLATLDAYFFVAVVWALGGLILWASRRKFVRVPGVCVSATEIPASWTRRVTAAQGSAKIIHHGDLVLVVLAAVFMLVGLAFSLPRVTIDGWQVWQWDVDAPSADGLAYRASAWALPWAVAFVLLRVRKAATANRVRRFFGQLWDVLSFWPRRHHPFAVRPYSHIAVPALCAEMDRLTQNDQRLVVSAHSQGSALAVAALAMLPAQARKRVALVTYGSHVSGLYRRAFPEYFNPKEVACATEGLGGTSVPRWYNFYRYTDPIGGPMFVDAPVGARGYDHCLPDPAVDTPRALPDDHAPPRETDREPFVALAVHSYYLSEQRLKEVVRGVKDDLLAMPVP
jgi:hypothetical protein